LIGRVVNAPRGRRFAGQSHLHGTRRAISMPVILRCERSEPRRMHGPAAAVGPFVLRGRRFAAAPQDDGAGMANPPVRRSL